VTTPLQHRRGDRCLFGPFEFRPSERRLLRRGVPLTLGSRALDILAVLTERPGEVITKQDLIARVWPDAVVVEAALRVHMVALRRALSEGEDGESLIKTVPGRGYAFVGDLESAHGAVEGGAAPSRPPLRLLPARPIKVVGRDAVVEDVTRQLERQRFVTLVGPGGIGKTTVALLAAHNWVAVHGDAAVFVDLSELGPDGSEGVWEALCAKLGLAPQGMSPADNAIAYLRSNPALIVLDTCEGDIEAAARLAESLVAAAPCVRVLATSREALRAEDEVVSRVGPLAAPPAGRDLIAREALEFPAVQLFVQRATANDLGFELGDEQAVVVGGICRELDGIALAIELAASRVDAFGIQRVADLLATEFALTWPGRRTAAPRQQTLRATLNWSHELLGPVERVVFRRLTVLVGAFPLEAATAVCAEDAGLPATDVADAVGSLVAKSLLNAVTDGPTRRFRMLDTTRSYALAKLAECGDEPTTRLRHAEYYLDLLKRAEAEAPSRPIAEWIADYAMEIGNLRAALDWAHSPAGDASLGVALTTAAAPLWLGLSLLEECRSRVKQAFGALATLPGPDAREEMRLHTALGTASPEPPEVAAAYTRVLELAEALDDWEHQLLALRGLYHHRVWTNQFSAALSFAQRFCDLAESKSNQSDQIIGQRLLGTSKLLLGDLAGARRDLEQVLVRYSAPDLEPTAIRFDDVIRFQYDGRVAARVFLTDVLWRQGFPDQAIRMAEENLAEAQAIGHVGSQCIALSLGSCASALWVGDLTAAADYTRLLVELSTEHGVAAWAPYGTRYRRVIALKGGNVDGIAEIDVSDAHLRSLTAWAELADALVKSGRSAEGLSVLDGLAEQSYELGSFTPEFLRLRGELLLLQTAPASAKPSEDLFRQALELAGRYESLSWELRAATSLARLLRDQDRQAEAAACLQPIYDRFTEGFGAVDLIEAERLLDELSGLDEARHAG
jgi:predicted ATPase/DNA-binding winged helix-turn-helix (wHTH) protein